MLRVFFGVGCTSSIIVLGSQVSTVTELRGSHVLLDSYPDGEFLGQFSH